MQISQSLQDGIAHREIAERFHVSEDSVQRHRRHLDAALVNAKTDSFAEKWQQIYARADEIFASMNVQGDARAALQALQQQAGALEVSMRLHKEAEERESDKTKELPLEKQPLTIELLDAELRKTKAWYRSRGLIKKCSLCSRELNPIADTFDEHGNAVAPTQAELDVIQLPEEREKPN